MQNFLINLLLTGAGLSIITGVLVVVLKKVLQPIVDKHRKTAQDVATVADELVDILVAYFPNVKWDDAVQQLVHKLIDKLGLSRADAEDAIKAALIRNEKAPNPKQVV